MKSKKNKIEKRMKRKRKKQNLIEKGFMTRFVASKKYLTNWFIRLYKLNSKNCSEKLFKLFENK